MVQNTQQLQAKLDAAAQAEKSLLLQSEEVVDGGCKDHHAEVCGTESCCAFWAKAGQCLADSSHREWMNVRCARSCGSCSGFRWEGWCSKVSPTIEPGVPVSFEAP